MSERFTKLYSLPGDLYCEGAPLMVRAGALLKDNPTGRVLAQMKFASLSSNRIKAVTVKIYPLDTQDKPLGEPVEYTYLDLDIPYAREFGSKVPVFLPDSATRAFRVELLKVVFDSNSEWSGEGTVLSAISHQDVLESVIGDPDLRSQFNREFGNSCRYAPRKVLGLKQCACGALDAEDEQYCHSCGAAYEKLLPIDTDALKENLEKYNQEQAEAAAREAEQAAKNKALAIKCLKIGIPIFAAFIIINSIVSSNNKKREAYEAATALAQKGKYIEAAESFDALGKYKDSKDKAVEALFDFGKRSVEKRDYSKVSTAINNLSGRPGSEDEVETLRTMILDSKYADATALLNSGELDEAKNLFLELRDYKDSAEHLSRFGTVDVLTQVKTDTYTDTYNYDVRGVLMSVDRKASVKNGVSYTMSYGYKKDKINAAVKKFAKSTATESSYYDDHGNLTLITYFSGNNKTETLYTNEYSESGALIKKTVEKSYYQNNKPVSNTSVPTWEEFTYDEAGNPLHYSAKTVNATDVLLNYTEVSYTRDESGKSVASTYVYTVINTKTNKETKTEYHYTYAYDDKGNIVRETKLNDADRPITETKRTFTYDNQGRITSVESVAGKTKSVETYTYSILTTYRK